MGLDPVSFVFAQVLQQIEWLYEGGHISPQAYAAVIANLVQTEEDEIASPVLSPSDSDATFADYPFASAGPSRSASQAPPPSASERTNEPPTHPSRGKSFASRLMRQSKDDAGAPPPQPSQKQSTSSGRRKNIEPPQRKKTPKERKKEVEEVLDPDEPTLGPVNKGIRRALEGGWLIGTAVDQALALTPGVPGIVRDRVVDSSQEKAGPWVRKLTDPRNQAKARTAVTRSYSGVRSAVRRDGNKSDSSSPFSLTDATPSTSASSSAGTSALPGLTLGPYAVEGDTEKGESAMSITSVHAFIAAPDLEITSVITASFLPPVARAMEQEAAAATGGEAMGV